MSIDPKAIEAAKRIVARSPAEAFVDAIFEVCPLTPEEYAKVLPEHRAKFDGSEVVAIARALLAVNAEVAALEAKAEKYATMAMHFERLHGEAVNSWVNDDSGWQKRALAAEAELAALRPSAEFALEEKMRIEDYLCANDGLWQSGETAAQSIIRNFGGLRQAVREQIADWELRASDDLYDQAQQIAADELREKTAAHMGAPT